MQLGMVGLGKMGGNMVERLRAAGHEVVGFDANPAVSEVPSLAAMVDRLTDSPRVVWVMVPVQFLEQVLDDLGGLLGDGDIVIDGGNSKWTGDAPRAASTGCTSSTAGSPGASGARSTATR